MHTGFYNYRSSGEAGPQAVMWEANNINAILILVHGTTEHIERYDKFAAAMIKRGVAVTGIDLRGHGHNPGDPDVVEYQPGDWQRTVEDVQQLLEFWDRKFPGMPKFLMGFSLGSFVVQDLLKTYPRNKLAGVILMGTGHQPGWLLRIMRRIVAGQIKKVGFDRPSALVRKLSFGVYNDKFKPNRTDVDWLSANEAAVDAYLADPLVRRQTSAGMFWELLGSMQRHSSGAEYANWDKDLPVLLISGSEDPVGNAGKGVATVCRQMKKAGMKDVTMHLIPGARHAILMDSPKEVQNIIVDWVKAHE